MYIIGLYHALIPDSSLDVGATTFSISESGLSVPVPIIKGGDLTVDTDVTRITVDGNLMKCYDMYSIRRHQHVTRP